MGVLDSVNFLVAAASLLSFRERNFSHTVLFVIADQVAPDLQPVQGLLAVVTALFEPISKQPKPTFSYSGLVNYNEDYF